MTLYVWLWTIGCVLGWFLIGSIALIVLAQHHNQSGESKEILFYSMLLVFVMIIFWPFGLFMLHRERLVSKVADKLTGKG